MRLLPWDYGVRNLMRRPMRTALTALGLTLVVFLLLLVVGFLQGLNGSLRESGDEQVVLIHSMEAAENLEQSSIFDQVPKLVESDSDLSPHLLRYAGRPAVSPELTFATTIGAEAERERGQLGVLRGVDFERVFLVRRKVHIIDGQLPKAGEVLVGRLAATKLGSAKEDLAVGKAIIIEGKNWRISGQFAAPGTLLEAEVWCPLDELKLLAKRPNDISLVALRLDPQGDRRKQLGDLEYFCRDRNRELELMGSREADYYASLKQHYGMMRTLAWLLVVLVGGAGACGAINTMYAAVAGRVREFATLQAIGYSRRAIAVSLIQESVLLAALGTLVATGLGLLLIQGTAIRFTMGAFALQLDRIALLIGCGVGLSVGIVGAVPPVIRAFRLPIAAALKAV